MNLRHTIASTLTIALAAGAAQAAMLDVRIDFNTGTTAATAPGGNWNTVIHSASSQSLIDFNTGLSSGTTITVSGWTTLGGGTNNWNEATNPGPTWLDAGKLAAEDRIYNNPNATNSRTGTITIAGLDSSKQYIIELVAAENTSNANTAADFQVQSGPVTAFNIKNDGYTAGNWLTWTNVTPISGSITITAMGDINTQERISANALRVLEVPEPGSLALVGIASLLLLPRRQR